MKSQKLDQLLSEFGNDPVFHWPNAKRQGTAANRITERESILVKHKPKFFFNEKDRFFTIGSCFARNIERKLDLLELPVLSNKLDIPQHWIAHAQAKNTDILNKFNIHSMLHELERTARGGDTGEKYLIQLDDDRFYDPQTSYTAIVDAQSAKSLRGKISELYEKLSKSSVIILTLGMTESWIDNETGTYINGLPHPEVIKRHKSRFSFFNADLRSIEEALHEIVRLLNHICGNQVKIVFTVSPVPLRRTFSGKDIFIANTYSKSTLRLAAESVSNDYSNVDYYPSYEMVMNSPRESAWQEDTIHVADQLVGEITSYFARLYMDDSP